MARAALDVGLQHVHPWRRARRQRGLLGRALPHPPTTSPARTADRAAHTLRRHHRHALSCTSPGHAHTRVHTRHTPTHGHAHIGAAAPRMPGLQSLLHAHPHAWPPIPPACLASNPTCMPGSSHRPIPRPCMPGPSHLHARPVAPTPTPLVHVWPFMHAWCLASPSCMPGPSHRRQSSFCMRRPSSCPALTFASHSYARTHGRTHDTLQGAGDGERSNQRLPTELLAFLASVKYIGSFEEPVYMELVKHSQTQRVRPPRYSGYVQVCLPLTQGGLAGRGRAHAQSWLLATSCCVRATLTNACTLLRRARSRCTSTRTSARFGLPAPRPILHSPLRARVAPLILRG